MKLALRSEMTVKYLKLILFSIFFPKHIFFHTHLNNFFFVFGIILHVIYAQFTHLINMKKVFNKIIGKPVPTLFFQRHL